ncbi:MAG: sensor domain-containing diguanylate cyclase [Lachnospiraceae bacterium]|nr:sensor domain-containing diguanylate cyclase [Lachnospiraceae bacterium]
MGKAEKSKSNSTTVQWAIPTILLMIFLVFTLINYNKTMQENARNKALDRVSRQAVSIAGYYKGLYEGTVNVTDAIADYLMDEEDIFGEKAVKLLKLVDDHSGLIDAYIIKTNGNAVDSYGQRYGKIDIYEDIKSVLATRDGALSIIDNKGRPVLVVSSPIRTEEDWRGNVVLVYKADRISKLMDSTAYCYALVFSNGIVGEIYGGEKQSLLKLGDDLNETLLKVVFEDGSASSFMKSMQSGRSGTVHVVTSNGTGAYLCHQPIGRSGASVLVLVQDNQINLSILEENQDTRSMIMKVLFSIGVFVALIIIIYIINRVSFTKESMELQNKAETDLLTELLNKISTENKIKEYLEGEGRDKTSMMCVLDIDNFKKINDTMGHAFGDEVLATLGKRIRTEFRVTDIIGRTGGDEFIIFLKDLKDDNVIEREAGRVAGFFKDFTVGTYTKYSPTASIGAAIYSRDGRDYESLYKAADAALYKAKKRGKNQLAFFSETTDADVLAAERGKTDNDDEDM